MKLCKHGKGYPLLTFALYSNVPLILLLQLKFEIRDLIGIFEHVFAKLKVNPSKHKVGIWHFVITVFLCFAEVLIRCLVRRLVCPFR